MFKGFFLSHSNIINTLYVSLERPKLKDTTKPHPKFYTITSIHEVYDIIIPLHSLTKAFT